MSNIFDGVCSYMVFQELSWPEIASVQLEAHIICAFGCTLRPSILWGLSLRWRLVSWEQIYLRALDVNMAFSIHSICLKLNDGKTIQRIAIYYELVWHDKFETTPSMFLKCLNFAVQRSPQRQSYNFVQSDQYDASLKIHDKSTFKDSIE